MVHSEYANKVERSKRNFRQNFRSVAIPSRKQERRRRAANTRAMETADVARRVASDTDDVLATIPLVAGNAHLSDHLFEQLVDLLLEGMLVDLRRQLADGLISSTEYGDELATLATQCRAAGLLSR